MSEIEPGCKRCGAPYWHNDTSCANLLASCLSECRIELGRVKEENKLLITWEKEWLPIFFDIANITSEVYSTIKPKIDKLAASKGIGSHDWRPGLNKVARMICDEMDKRKGVDDGM